MNKEDWKDALKRLEAILVDAMDTSAKSKRDIDELAFMIKHYKRKIETFK